MDDPRYCPHCSGRLDVAKLIAYGGWVFDEQTSVLEPGAIKFTRGQGAIIAALLRANGHVVHKRGGLYAAITGDRPEVDWPSMKVIDIQISHIRRLLRKNFGRDMMIKTIWGLGYRAVSFDEIPYVPLQGLSKRLPA